MFHDLAVFNLSSSEVSGGLGSTQLNSSEWLHWSTCVRRMQIGFTDWLDGAKVSSEISLDRSQGKLGVEAYRYLLEVICGLHSPMLGETEVLGQFRERIQTMDYHPRLSKILNSLVSDAKIIRQNHLTNLGANSYGSLTRKYLRDIEDVAILGTGKLATEILPWLKTKNTLEMFSRSAEAKLGRMSSFPKLKILDINGNESSPCRGVVVAAPVDCKWLNFWLKERFPDLKLVIDLREDSKKENDFPKYWSEIRLQDFFSELNSNQESIRDRIDLAKSEIRKYSEQRLKKQEIRPFGWDDICA